MLKGQFIGEVKAPDDSDVGMLWTHLDPDRSAGTAIFTGKDARSYVLRMVIRDSGERQIVLGPAPELERIYSLETPVPPAARAELTLTNVDEQRIQGQFVVNGVEPSRRGSFDLYKLDASITPASRTFATWAECKQWMDSHRFDGDSYYRGQSRPLPLTTSFHRTGRVDLVRWLHEDLPQFADYASTVLTRSFKWDDLSERGALVGLAQHHGFPTPMLDWSKSPYVSAFFAFAGVVEAPKSEDPVRLFRLRPEFSSDFPVQPGTLTAITPNAKVELFRPPAMGNTRLLSQQGVMLFSNVPAPEEFIRLLESRNSRSYLEVVDVSSTACREALADLRRMGITAAALFPGLDGVGLALKHELFYNP